MESEKKEDGVHPGWQQSSGIVGANQLRAGRPSASSWGLISDPRGDQSSPMQTRQVPLKKSWRPNQRPTSLRGTDCAMPPRERVLLSRSNLPAEKGPRQASDRRRGPTRGPRRKRGGAGRGGGGRGAPAGKEQRFFFVFFFFCLTWLVLPPQLVLKLCWILNQSRTHPQYPE